MPAQHALQLTLAPAPLGDVALCASSSMATALMTKLARLLATCPLLALGLRPTSAANAAPAAPKFIAQLTTAPARPLPSAKPPATSAPPVLVASELRSLLATRPASALLGGLALSAKSSMATAPPTPIALLLAMPGLFALEMPRPVFASVLWATAESFAKTSLVFALSMPTALNGTRPRLALGPRQTKCALALLGSLGPTAVTRKAHAQRILTAARPTRLPLAAGQLQTSIATAPRASAEPIAPSLLAIALPILTADQKILWPHAPGTLRARFARALQDKVGNTALFMKAFARPTPNAAPLPLPLHVLGPREARHAAAHVGTLVSSAQPSSVLASTMLSVDPASASALPPTSSASAPLDGQVSTVRLLKVFALRIQTAAPQTISPRTATGRPQPRPAFAWLGSPVLFAEPSMASVLRMPIAPVVETLLPPAQGLPPTRFAPAPRIAVALCAKLVLALPMTTAALLEIRLPHALNNTALALVAGLAGAANKDKAIALLTAIAT